MANLTATQISELNSMCAGAYRASLGTELADLQTRMDNIQTQVITKLYSLGTPIAADDDRIVVIGNGTMKVGDYTLSAQPDVPRNVTVTHDSVGTTDTLGTITVTGTDVNDEVISEEITPVADSAVSGLKAFKTITTVTGAGWVVDEVEETADTVIVGVGDALGLPVVIALETSILMGFVGVAPIVPVVLANAAISNCTANLTTGTYDGTKVVSVFITQ